MRTDPGAGTAGTGTAAEPGWLRRFHPAAPDAPDLLCLPHAGGSAGSWFGLSGELAPDVSVVAVQYPGRQDRAREPVVYELERLADQVAAAVRPLTWRPYAMLGHSMGATLAYEVVRRLDRPPCRLFVSGRRAPSSRREDTVRLLDDDGLLGEMARLGAIHPRVLGRPAVRRAVLRVVRGDYHAIETHRSPPGPPLRCPIVALAGAADPMVDVREFDAWADHGSGLDLHVLPGGHFFVHEQAPAVAALVRAGLAPR